MQSAQIAKTKHLLDKLYEGYNFRERVLDDPIEFPHKYKVEADIEVAGYIAASLAYGKVTLFKPVINEILAQMGESPGGYLYEFNIKKNKSDFLHISYRFNKGIDITALIYILHIIFREFGSLKKAFLHFFNGNMHKSISDFFDYMLAVDTTPVYNNSVSQSGKLQFFPSPRKGSACKRINMFLRWMVRDRDIDFGIWKEIPGNSLVIPLDTHIARISRCLGLTTKKSGSWRTAVEITEALKKLDPLDPLKYDFALCHLGISGYCNTGRDESACRNCEINTHDPPDYLEV